MNPAETELAAVSENSSEWTDSLERFWEPGVQLEIGPSRIEAAKKPLELLERLGPSPFERGGFPVMGFLATAYEKVARYALEQG